MSDVYSLLPTCHLRIETRIEFTDQSACYLFFVNFVSVGKIRLNETKTTAALSLYCHFHPSSLWFLSINYKELGQALEIIFNIINIFPCSYTCIMYVITY